jgi:molybdopterin synthase catalytic subunit
MKERFWFRTSAGPVTGAWAQERVSGDDAGCTVLFLGTVRATRGERRVLRLEYEAYGAMLEPELQRIAAGVLAEHDVLRIAVDHSLGAVPAGAGSIAVAVAAAHRAAGFAAAKRMMDELKERAPLWKREMYEDGSSWIGQGS